MPVSKKQQACVARYMKAHYDRLNITVPKGERETIKAHAEKMGESLNEFVKRAIARTMEEDNQNKQS
jgi:predicted HicB family RNase H-like nuclease